MSGLMKLAGIVAVALIAAFTLLVAVGMVVGTEPTLAPPVTVTTTQPEVAPLYEAEAELVQVLDGLAEEGLTCVELDDIIWWTTYTMVEDGISPDEEAAIDLLAYLLVKHSPNGPFMRTIDRCDPTQA
jgi:hypothetical protein